MAGLKIKIAGIILLLIVAYTLWQLLGFKLILPIIIVVYLFFMYKILKKGASKVKEAAEELL
jgi:hypothetical protein